MTTINKIPLEQQGRFLSQIPFGVQGRVSGFLSEKDRKCWERTCSAALRMSEHQKYLSALIDSDSRVFLFSTQQFNVFNKMDLEKDSINDAACRFLSRRLFHEITTSTIPDRSILSQGNREVFKKIRSLSFSGDLFAFHDPLKFISLFSHLKKLAFEGSVTTLMAVVLSEKCAELQSLQLMHLAIEDGPMISLANRCKQLACITLTTCMDLTEKAFLALASCSSLTEVRFYFCSGITDRVLSAFGQNPLLIRASFVGRGCLHESQEMITDQGVIAFAQGCPNLTDINFSSHYNITDKALEALGSSCKQLTRVNIGNWSITDAGVASFAQKCSLLTELNCDCCNQITDQALIALAACPLLKKATFAECERITDAGVVALAQKHPRLERVSFSDNKKLTDASLFALAEICKQLVSVSFPKCNQLTDAAIRRLVGSCPQLKNVYVDGCPQLTDRSVVSLSIFCPELTDLSFHDCKKVTGQAFLSLPKVRFFFTSIVFSRCKNLTDDPLIAFIEHCPRLERIILEGCYELTDAVIFALAASGLPLKYISVIGCQEMTRFSFKVLKEKYPTLRLQTSLGWI